MSDTVSVYFDGAAEPNPGLATWGFVVRHGGETIHAAGGVAAERGSNNLAEYTALERALAWVRENAAGLPAGFALRIFGDSQLVVNQVAGSWNCNHEHLRVLRDRCRELLDGLGSEWSLSWVPREQNAEADRQSVLAWCGHTGRPFPERRRTK